MLKNFITVNLMNGVDWKGIKPRKGELLKYLSDGRNSKESGFTDAYFTNPENIESLFGEFKLKPLRVLATEGLAAMCENTLMQLTEEDFQEWVDVLYKISNRKVMWGASEHFIYVGRKVE